MKKIAIFASGSGTNAERIIRFFSSNSDIKVSLILTNKKDAGVLQRAENLKIRAVIFDRETFYNSGKIEKLLAENEINLIVLAGFLWMVPETLLKKYPNRIINIHPALLPKYGGKGMYGHHVHKAVIDNHEIKSGISIHYVNEKYDEGQVIFQAELDVLENDTPDSLANRIHELEYRHYPEIIEMVINELD